MTEQKKPIVTSSTPLKRAFDPVTLPKNSRFARDLHDLCIAALLGEVEIVEKILDKHKKYLAKNPYAINAAYVRKEKMEDGTEITSINANALSHAVGNDQIGTAKLLLDRGADVTCKSEMEVLGEVTVLHGAVFVKDKDMLSLLLKAKGVSSIIDEKISIIDQKINGKKVNPGNWTALNLACGGGVLSADVDESAADAEMARLLLDAGASPYIRNGKGNNALDEAKRMGNADVIKLLEGWMKKHPESEYQSAKTAPTKPGL